MRADRVVPSLLTAALAAGALTLGAVPAANAQPYDCPRGGRADPTARVDVRLRTLTARLGLDARQVPRVRAILDEHARRVLAVRAMPPGPDKLRARQDLRTWTHAQIRALLSPAQQSTFDAMRAERRRNGRGGGWGRGRGGGRGRGDGWGRGGDV